MASSSAPSLAPGNLWNKIQQQTGYALACGALQPIDTHYEFIDQGGMRFLVRILANLARKEKASQSQQPIGKDFNPFLPYDKDLFVANLSDTHLCLLNKYNVVDHHILIITRAFEDQDTWLTLADFEALAFCMAEIDGLAFYNGGRLAGASQRHKHLQLVPPSLCPDGSPLPLDLAIQRLEMMDKSGQHSSRQLPSAFQHPDFAFRHTIVSLRSAQPLAANTLLAAYYTVLSQLGVKGAEEPSTLAYNLLITREWMMGVCRRQEHYQSIPVNSLGFAGSLLVKNQAQLTLLKTLGPMTVLEKVACQGIAPGGDVRAEA
jgi:ATP adenylyltransferase